MLTYREHLGYRELLARARERDPKAHVVCSPTRMGGFSVTLTMRALQLRVSVRAKDLDVACDAALAAMEAA